MANRFVLRTHSVDTGNFGYVAEVRIDGKSLITNEPKKAILFTSELDAMNFKKGKAELKEFSPYPAKLLKLE